MTESTEQSAHDHGQVNGSGAPLNSDPQPEAASPEPEPDEDVKLGPQPVQPGDSTVSLPRIQANERELRHVSGDCLDALRARNNPPRLFVRGGKIVQIAVDERERATISMVQPIQLRAGLTRCANFFVRGPRGSEVAVPPPFAAVQDVLALSSDQWGFPPLEGITEVPVLRPDGTIVDKPGYDAATRWVYSPPAGFTLPSIPFERFQPLSALVPIAEIEEVLCDFPFADAASRANVIAMLLTPLLRPSIRGNVPMALINAPRAGTGKGLLAEVLSIIATGACAAMKPAPGSHRFAEDEWRKMLTAAFLAGDPLVILDNVDVELDSSALALALTAGEWKDRILGRNEQVSLPQRTTFISTGNNIQLGGDMPRRCYWIRLDAKQSRPWERKWFRHPDLKGYVMDRRCELVAALLTLASAWFAAGQPPADTPILGSFEEWSRMMGGILHYAGIQGFLGNLDELYEQADASEGQWESFLHALYERSAGKEFTTKEARSLINPPQDVEASIALPDEITERLRGDNLAQQLGQAFRAKQDRRFGESGIRVERAGQTRDKVAVWVIRTETS